MTSASELFYSRRTRAGRFPGSAVDSPFLDTDRDRDRDRDHPNHHQQRSHRRQYRHRLYYDGCDPSRRYYSSSHGGGGGTLQTSRHPCHRISQTEHESIQLDLSGTSESSLGNGGNREALSSRISHLRVTGNERLPGAVLQARARLLERLRGVSISANRLSTSSSGISWDEFAVSDDFWVIDSGDYWESETQSEWSEPSSPFTDSTAQAEQSSYSQDPSKKKPPGLTPETWNRLPREVFTDQGESSSVSRVSVECCICIEKFREGDGLIRLSCGHRFHTPCLDPWVRMCGDCPYCRTRIVTSSPGAGAGAGAGAGVKPQSSTAPGGTSLIL